MIALPEGLLLLLGLLASPSLSPSIVETTITKISLWIKMDAANATKILSCGHWQRWFLGLYLVFEKRNSESSSERSAMAVSQSIVADIIACLYSQLILRVKHGYQQWRVTLKLLEHHADRTSILRNLLSLSFRRLYSDLQQQKRTNKQLSSATADNIVYTFQLVDQWILPAKQTSANSIPETENYALEKSKILAPMCNIYALLRSAGGIVQRQDGDIHARAIPMLRILIREIPTTPTASVLPMLQTLLDVVGSDMTSSTIKSRQIILRVVFALQQTMLQNDNASDITQKAALAVLSLVNNRNLGNVVEGWGAEEVAGAMRPQAGELPEKSAHRVFELLTPAMISEISRNNVGSQNILSGSGNTKINKQNALEYQWIDVFAVSKRKASVVVDRQVRLSTVDVKELRNRQNARSNLDQQRFEVFLKTIDATRSQTYGFFTQRIWPSLKMGYHTPWSCDHRIRRYFL